MCMLCGDTAEQGKLEALYLAAQLKRMAAIQEGLGTGRIKPHEGGGSASSLAHSIIRNLVADYL